MTRAPVISVALATYNGERFLREQLDSIYAPCAVPFEVVASDDGSTDGTREILRDYARRHGLRDVSDGQRRGLVQNFAHALSHCVGDFVALSDQDDLWVPGRLDALLAALGDHQAVYSLIDRVLSPAGVIVPWPAPPGIREFARTHGTGRPTARLLASNWVIGHTMLVRRAVVQAALPIPAGQPYHDAWLALAASAKGGLRYLEPSLTIYRQHAASHTAAAQAPAQRRALGLARESWLAKCQGELARLGDCAAAPFLDAEARAFARRLAAYYQRGLRRGVSLRMGAEARRLAPYFFSSLDTRWRRNFVLRGFLGAL